MEKKDLLNEPVRHIDIKSFDSSKIIEAMKDMSFTARDTAKAAELLKTMINDPECTIMQEARSWGKVDTGYEQMVYAEAGSVLPLIVSDEYHQQGWESRIQRQWAKIFE